MKRTKSSRNIVGMSVCLAVATAGAMVFAWRSHERAEAVRAARPPHPDLSNWPEEFRRRASLAARRDTLAGLGELSRLYHANGFFAEAGRCYDALERLQPAEPRWLHRHAAIHAGFGEAESAIARWRRVIAMVPDYLPASLRLGEMQAKSEHPADAAQTFGQVLKRKPDEPYALLGLARLDVDANRWDDARRRLEAVAAASNYDLGSDLLVTIYEHCNERAKADALRGRAKAAGTYRDPPDPWLDELVDDCFDAYRLSLAAGLANRAGNVTRAIGLLERAVSFAPSDVGVRFQLGVVHEEHGDPAKARAEFEQCTRLAPQFPDAWSHLAAVVERAGDRRAAAQIVAAGLQRCSQSPGLHLMRARQLRDAGQVPAAIDEYRASIRFRPNEADACLELATLLFRAERVPEGLTLLQQALAAEPGHPMVIALLAFHAISARDEAAARKWLVAVREQPRVPGEQVEQLLRGFREQFGRDFR